MSRRSKELEEKIFGKFESTDRYIDTSVRIAVIKPADSTAPGAFELAGGRWVIQVGDPICYGGLLDTAVSPPCLVERYDGTREPAASWRCSEDQWRVIDHPDCDPVGKLVVGGMGAGKTTAGVIWVYRRWQESIGSGLEGGVTAPTETRLSLVFNEIFRMFPKPWWQFRSSENMLTMCDGFRIRGVSTYQQSDAQGSRIQGFNWIWWLGDELQDQIDQFTHIQARLRSKVDGRAKRLGTATAKDDPQWRSFTDKTLGTGLWAPYSLLGPSSPFVHQNHWDAMRRSLTDRDYRRLVLAEDLPPESRVYNGFNRKINVRQIPLGARRITSLVVRKKIGGDGWGVGIGHDPGTAKAASVWLDAYELPRRVAETMGCPIGDHIWFVRDELFTHHETPEQHAVKAMAKTRDRFGVNIRPDEERAHVRCQPLGSAEDKPDTSTLATWRRIGFDIRVAQYGKSGQGVGQIKKDARLAVVNTLFEKRRLFLECDDRGECLAPLLLSALETMERDHLGRAEHEEKDVRHDKSDLPAAMGYWLWPWEKEFATALRSDIRKSLG